MDVFLASLQAFVDLSIRIERETSMLTQTRCMFNNVVNFNEAYIGRPILAMETLIWRRWQILKDVEERKLIAVSIRWLRDKEPFDPI
jgi:hypothetical protein